MEEPRTREGSTDEFESLPLPAGPGKKPSRWIPTLEKLRQGKVIFIPYSSAKEMKGIRIGLARMAGGGDSPIKLEFRLKAEGDETRGELAVRRHPTAPYVPTPPKTDGGPKRPTGRPKATADAQ